MTLQELIHMFGANKKYYVSDTVFTKEQTHQMFNFPHVTLTNFSSENPKTYIICDDDFNDSRFSVLPY